MSRNRDFDAVTVGEAMVLLIPDPLGPLSTTDQMSMSVAGAEATVAQYLAMLGHQSAWISSLGADPFGSRVLATLTESGVDTRYVSIDPMAPTAVYFKDPQPDGSTRVWYYRAGSAASRMTSAAVLEPALCRSRVLHVTGITAALSESCRDLVSAVLVGRVIDTELVSFDVNYRPALWRLDDPAATLLSLANAADLVFVGLDEASGLWGTTDATAVRELLSQPPRVVVKDAAIGATAFVADEPPVFVPASAVDVVEPTGAGDAFAAGYLHGWLRGLSEAERLQIGHRLAGASLRAAADVDALPDGLSPSEVRRA